MSDGILYGYVTAITNGGYMLRATHTKKSVFIPEGEVHLKIGSQVTYNFVEAGRKTRVDVGKLVAVVSKISKLHNGARQHSDLTAQSGTFSQQYGGERDNGWKNRVSLSVHARPTQYLVNNGRAINLTIKSTTRQKIVDGGADKPSSGGGVTLTIHTSPKIYRDICYGHQRRIDLTVQDHPSLEYVKEGIEWRNRVSLTVQGNPSIGGHAATRNQDGVKSANNSVNLETRVNK